jgi:hypothetical protein
METQTLIDTLAVGLRPVSRRAVGVRLATGAAGGSAAALVLVALWLGFRPDLPAAILGGPFWMKWGYTIWLGVAALAVTRVLVRPDTGTPSREAVATAVVPVVLLAAVAVYQWVTTPMPGQAVLWFGFSWQVCAVRIFLVSLPIFAGLVWAIQGLAPVRLRLAGLAAGGAAGGLGAAVYALHCPEVSACFVLVWYSLGIVSTALLGALTGPRLLRW